jgi:hypothetical protein
MAAPNESGLSISFSLMRREEGHGWAVSLFESGETHERQIL